MGRISVNMKIKCRRKRRMNYGYEFLRFFFSQENYYRKILYYLQNKRYLELKKMEMHVVTTNQDNKKKMV